MADRKPREAPGEEQFDRELNLRGILGFLFGLVVVMLVVAGGMYLMSVGLKDHLEKSDPPPSPLPEANVHTLPPKPRLQTHPERELEEMRAEEDSVLYSYGWVDRDAGVVRVPIEEAMAWIAEHGVPAWPESASVKSSDAGSE
jgi:hypothetical protein